MFKEEKLRVRGFVEDLVQKYQHALNQKADMIDDDLDSTEKLYTSKMKENPKKWNTKSLHFNLKSNNNQDFPAALSLEVTLTSVSFEKRYSLEIELF